MGCVLGRPSSSGSVSESKADKNLSVESRKSKVENVVEQKVDGRGGGGGDGVEEVVRHEEIRKEEGKVVVDGEKKSRGERRKSRPNPRLSNPPKHLRGEQVAAGWPPWLTAVCGEALSGWIPRKADTFEKIDKVSWLILRKVICF